MKNYTPLKIYTEWDYRHDISSAFIGLILFQATLLFIGYVFIKWVNY